MIVLQGIQTSLQGQVGLVLKYLDSSGLLKAPQPLSKEYNALPVCAVDAVFSIGVKYQGVRNTVSRFCEKYGWEIYRKIGSPPATSSPTITDFLDLLAQETDESLADRVFENRQRTSTRNGILKAAAVRHFALALQRAGIDSFQDLDDQTRIERAKRGVLEIKGQRSGISFEYFRMLAGSDDHVKPDRMISRFVAAALGLDKVEPDVAAKLVHDAALQLEERMPDLTPRRLDHIIWNFESERAKKRSGRRIV